MNRSLFHLVVLIPGILLLQYHAILFWQSAVGLFVGPAWSLLLEVISFWCWVQKEKGWRHYLVRGLAILTVFLLLVGPLFTVSKSLGDEIEEFLTVYLEYQEKKGRLETQIEKLEKDADRLLGVIERTGDGYVSYNKRKREIEAYTALLNRTESPSVTLKNSYRSYLVVLMQFTAIFIIQIVIILTILKLARAYYGTDLTVTHTKTDKLILEIRALFLERKLSLEELSKTYELSSQALRYILNYHTLSEQGIKPFSRNMAESLHQKVFSKETMASARRVPNEQDHQTSDP